MSKKIVQTAGRDQLGEFAPMFAHLNDDVLFGEVWNEEAIDVKTKCIITVVSLMASGITDSSLTYHLQNAKAHGVTKDEIAAIITHATMYVGWPKGWAVFRLAKEVWNEDVQEFTEKDKYQNSICFPIGEANPYGEFFVGQSYLAPVSTEQVPVFNVTFEPGCRNNWHIHHAENGGGQMLICIGGRGYYQEWGKEAVEMTPGTVINIPAEVKHWHGAAPDYSSSCEMDGLTTCSSARHSPFCSHGGGRFGQSLTAIAKLAPEADMGEGPILFERQTGI